MRAGMGLIAGLAALAVFLGAGCGGGGGGGGEAAPPATTGAQQTSTEPAATEAATTAGEVKKGGILRVGTVNYIDSLNPWHYIEAQSLNAMFMIYPQLVQMGPGLQIQGDWAQSWETSPDGKDWTFHLVPGAKWSDGQPMTADDAAWTINTTVKYANGPTAVLAASLAHVAGAEALDDTTLVVHYEQPVGNVLAQLEQFIVMPRHVWEPLAGADGKGLKTYRPEQNLPIVSGGAYTIKQYEKKGTTVFLPDPNFYGPASNAEAVALTYYTNADSMIADLKAGDLDWVDQVPFSAIDVLQKEPDVVVQTAPGDETTNITWNSNPRKPENRELLDPRVKKALSMCVDRQQIIDVVFNGHAELVESLVGHISPLENPNLGPLEHNCDEGNRMLDELGYARGSDGTRVVPATTGEHAQAEHKMEYEILTPTSTDFNVDREFEIVKAGFAEAGVKVTQKVGGDATATYAIETGDDCDAEKSTGYTGWDIAMWDWIGYPDPDAILSYVTKAQWCSWSDTGWDNPDYDELYLEQGTTIDPEKRKEIVWQMQQMIYDNFLYTQLVNEQKVDAHRKEWDGFYTELNSYSKLYYTSPHQVG